MFRTIVNVLNISLYSATCLYAMPLLEALLTGAVNGNSQIFTVSGEVPYLSLPC